MLAHELHTRLHALELNPPVRHSYIPICFVPSEKLATSDKLLFAFDALALSRTFGKKPRLGKIIHGRQYVTVTVPLTGLLPKARSVLDRIADQRAEATPPPLVLNKHCAECLSNTSWLLPLVSTAKAAISLRSLIYRARATGSLPPLRLFSTPQIIGTGTGEPTRSSR